MNKITNNSIFTTTIIVSALLAITSQSKGIDCNPSFLDSCVPAFKDPKANVSDKCCDNLEEKKPCICVWYKDPESRGMIYSTFLSMAIATIFCRRPVVSIASSLLPGLVVVVQVVAIEPFIATKRCRNRVN
ncbi:hypothetical protein R6Q59_034579 [Mikania micrantha]